MLDLPTGTVTFLFTDIEASTRLLQHLGDAGYAHVLAEHRRLVRAAFMAAGGRELETQGDGFLVVFPRATEAAQAAVAGQKALHAHPWPEGGAVRVRMALHSGEPVGATEGYVGLDLHKVQRICNAGYGGQILLSETTRSLIENVLPAGVSLRDLGVHRLKDLQRPEHIYQLLHPDLPVDFPPPRSLDSLPNNLPHQLTSFVGRKHEMADVKQLLSGTRLLTLIGSGGCGKTRLAIQVAADLVDTFEDGVWLVELAALADHARVPQAVATAIGVREQPGRPLLATVSDYLQSRQLLLVLDNCEHLLAACAHVTYTLLSACPRVRILATSREPLGITGAETSWRVPSLSAPDPSHLPPLEQLSEFDAVRLFIDRATTALPTFRVTSQNAPFVAQTCHRLDGIPLAIELAAARVKVLSVEQIARRLGDLFHLLTGGSRTALLRQQTLRATMDWSHDLLSPKEKTLFRRLAVFAGGWILDAAETICAVSPLDHHQVFDLLSQLTDKSLVAVDDKGSEKRYRMLEIVRQYAREKLRDAGEWESIHDRHLDLYVKLAEDAEPRLRGRDREWWLAQLESEHDNLRAALSWSHATEDTTEAEVRLAGSLWWFWYSGEYYAEGRKWLDLALSRADVPPSVRVKALYAAAYLSWRLGDAQQAEARSRESLALAEELGDRVSLAFSFLVRGIVTRSQDRYTEAASLHEKSLALFRELGYDAGIAWSLRLLGIVELFQGNYGRAAQLFEESRALYETLGDAQSVASSLYGLARVAVDEGDDAQARKLLAESLASFQQLGDKMGIAGAFESLGLLAARQHDCGRARSYLRNSLTIYEELGDRRSAAAVRALLGRLSVREGEHAAGRADLLASLDQRNRLGDKRGIAECLEGLAELAVAAGQPERSAKLFGAAERVRESISTLLPPADRQDYDRAVAAARAQLGNGTFGGLWGQGRSMTLDESVKYALTGA